ncbi:MAG: acyloxyacyl hydrolase [Acidobacteriota bacterium]
MKAGILASALTVLCATPLRAQSEPPIPLHRPPEWGLNAGYGIPVRLNSSTSNDKLVLFEPGVAFRVSGRCEYLVEGHFARYLGPGGSMVGALPLSGRLYLGNGRVLPYVSLGAGVGWTDLTALDEIDRRFNFLLQGSVGVRGATSDRRAWTLEARLSHVSNAGTVKPNYGLNMLVVLGGWRFR